MDELFVAKKLWNYCHVGKFGFPGRGGHMERVNECNITRCKQENL